MFRGEMGFQIVRFQQLAGVKICHQHVPALELPAAADVGIFLEQHARFAGQDQPLIVGQGASERAQAVAVQRRAHAVAVGIEDGGGTVRDH
jgi:hypothetical protein